MLSFRGGINVKEYNTALFGKKLSNYLKYLVNKYGGVYLPFDDTSGSVARVINPALALGRDVVINGDFASDTVWTKGTGWSIAGGVAHCDGSQTANSNLQQPDIISKSKTYETTFTVSNRSAGGVRLSLGGAAGVKRTANGTYTEIITAGTAGTYLNVLADLNFIGDIDNVIVRQTNILASTAYPGAELHTDANAASDPSGNEADATTGFGTFSATVTTDSSVKSTGNYSLKTEITGSAGSVYKDIGADFGLVEGKCYRISFDYRHVGVGGTQDIFLGSDPNNIENPLINSIPNSIDTFQSFSTEFEYDSTHRYLVLREVSATDDGGLYFDNFSLTEANPLNGDITGATINQDAGSRLKKAYLFDGTNDYVDVYSPELNSLFDPTKGTLLAFAKVSGAGVWTDGAYRTLTILQSDSNNKVQMQKSSVNNRLDWFYTAAGTTRTFLNTSVTTTDWFLVAITWDIEADEIKAYLNGVQNGATQTSPGTWVGNLSSTLSVIGAKAVSPASVWDGLICHPVLFRDVLTGAEILKIAKLGGVA